MCLVSVIIPLYNDELFVERCLDSVLSQTHTELEVICVNDGSTDKTVEMVKTYMTNDARVSLVSTINHNAGSARNRGLSIARGEFIMFLDGDDFFEKNMIKHALESIRKNSAQICVYRSDTYEYDTGEYKSTNWTIRKELIPAECFSPTDVKKDIFKVFVGWPWDKLYDTSFIKRSNLLFQEQRTTNDMVFVFMSIILAKKICVLDEVLAHHQRNYKSISNTREISWECFYHALSLLKDQLIKNDVFDRYEIDYVNYALHACLWNLETLSPPIQKQLFDKLKSEWFYALGIANKSETDFYNLSEYEKYTRIMAADYESYVAGVR